MSQSLLAKAKSIKDSVHKYVDKHQGRLLLILDFGPFLWEANSFLVLKSALISYGSLYANWEHMQTQS